MDGLGNPVPVLDDPGRTRFHVMDPVERKKRLREQGERREEDLGVLIARAVGAVTLSEESRLLDEIRRTLEEIENPRERRKVLEEWRDLLVQRGLKDEDEARALAGRVLRDLESEPAPGKGPIFKW